MALGKLTDEERIFLRDAIEKGNAIDQHMREMMRGIGTTAPEWLTEKMEGAAAPFSWMEMQNRKMALLAMYRVAKEQGADVEEGENIHRLRL